MTFVYRLILFLVGLCFLHGLALNNTGCASCRG